jgi:hypothetical protein
VLSDDHPMSLLKGPPSDNLGFGTLAEREIPRSSAVK